LHTNISPEKHDDKGDTTETAKNNRVILRKIIQSITVSLGLFFISIRNPENSIP
jgi:hypothetical protein